MATEKILNTRIQLKYDSFANWSTNNPTLKSGEVAIAYLGNTVDTTEVTPNNNTHPVMFKVGPGKFNDLPWASALAADVYSWAKKSEADFTTWVKSLINVTDIDAYSKSEVDTKLSDNSKADQKYADDLIAALDVTDTAVAGKYVSAVSETDGKISVERADLPTYTLATGSANGTVAFNGSDVAVKGLASAAYVTVDSLNTTAKGYADAAQTAAEGKVTELANGAVKANTEAIAVIQNGETGILAKAKAYADTVASNALTSAQGYADQAETDAIASAKAYTDDEIDKVEAELAKVVNGTTPVAKATDADKLGGTVASDYALKTYVDQAETDAVAAAKQYTDEVKAGILGEGITETFDTLKEIEEWITGSGVDATELTTAIAAETKAREEADTAIDGRLDNLEALVGENGKVSKAEVADVANSLSDSAKAEVKEVKVDNATHADAAGKVDNALTVTLEDGTTSVVYDGSTAKSFSLANLATKAYADQAEADAIATAAIDAKDKVDKALADAKAYADGKTSGSLSDAKSYADGLIAALDVEDAAVAGKYVSAVQEVDGKIEVSRADLPVYTLASGSANGSVAFNGTDVAVTGLKSAAYTESSAYATATQGALADSALQKADITIGSANGTIAVKGTDVAVKGLGSAAYTETSAYATAAQGTKADSALQEITTTANGGLKVTNKNQIDIDTNVVFVFNCGSSTELVD